MPSSSDTDSDSTDYSIGDVSFISESESHYDSDDNQEVNMVDDDCNVSGEEESEENMPTGNQSNL